MRIRVRLALFGAAVTAGAMVVFGIALGLLGRAGVASDQDEALADLARNAAAAVSQLPALAFDLPVAPLPTEAAASTEPFIVLLLDDGSLVYTAGLVDGEPLRVPAAVVVEAVEVGTSSATVDRGGTEVRIHAVPFLHVGSGTSGVVVAAQSAEFAEQQLAGLRAVIWAAGILVVIAAVVVGWLVSGRALRPLRRLAATADEVGRTGDLSSRLPPVRAKDEVGALTASFNGMLDRLQQAREGLQASVEAQQRFVADASHELRSPLTTIRNNAGFLIERSGVSEADRAEALADIAAEADRMARLVDDLLDLARGDAGERAAPVPVDLARVAAEARDRAARGGQAVELEAAPGVVVAGDHAELARLLRILLDNARDHGGGAARIEVRRAGDRARVVVRDRGPGVPEEDLEHVFERFYRADPARSPAGFGLGLAIAAGIVAAHRGTIRAANDDGAVFTVEIPIR